MGNAVERCWAPISPGPQRREPSLNPSVQPLTHARDGDLGYAFSTGHPPSFPTHQSGGCLLCGHSALVLAHTAEWIVPGSGFCYSPCLLPGSYLLHYAGQLTVLRENQELHISSIFGSPTQVFYIGSEGEVMVPGRCEEDGERLQQVLWMKNALKLEKMVRKGIWVKNKCRQEEQESGKRDAERSVGIWGAARITPSFPTMLWGHERQSQELR